MIDAVIMLSTFNGERFLQPLLDSLSAQTIPFTILWRDDGSSDRSKSIVREHGFTQLIELDHSPQGQPLGPAASFGRLLDAAQSYPRSVFFFCDQDDVWEPIKLASICAYFLSIDNLTPRLLVHDALLRDQTNFPSRNPKPVSTYFNKVGSLASLLCRNSALGCCMAMNHQMVELASPIPPEAVMHDWWVAILAKGVDGLVIVPDRLVEYRVHNDNSVGVTSSLKKLVSSKDRLMWLRQEKLKFSRLMQQAQCALERLGAEPKRDKWPDEIQYLIALKASTGLTRFCMALRLSKNVNFWTGTLFIFKYLLWGAWRELKHESSVKSI